jgi:hypothetical protein
MNQLTFRNEDQLDAIGLGTWKSAPGEVYKAVREAIKVGFIGIFFILTTNHQNLIRNWNPKHEFANN